MWAYTNIMMRHAVYFRITIKVRRIQSQTLLDIFQHVWYGLNFTEIQRICTGSSTQDFATTRLTHFPDLHFTCQIIPISTNKTGKVYSNATHIGVLFNRISHTILLFFCHVLIFCAITLSFIKVIKFNLNFMLKYRLQLTSTHRNYISPPNSSVHQIPYFK